MVEKLLRKLMIATLMIAWWNVSGAQSTCFSAADYQALGTFEWTDASGVTHENYLTDEATDPRHIMALLKEIYTNPAVPGIWYGGYTTAGVREGEVEYTAVPTWGITSDVQRPTQEGYTTMLVKVQDNWKSAEGGNTEVPLADENAVLDYLGQCVASVQLLTQAVRVPGDNPGTLYNINATANRFFFLSKGRARYETSGGVSSRFGRKPFYGMFEEYSPSSASATVTGLADFYTMMKNGETFAVVHDCSSVVWRNHYFCMAGEDGTTHYNINNLMFYIPDKRFTYWDNRNNGGSGGGMGSSTDFINYNVDYAPKTALYTVLLDADTVAGPNPGEYTVNLSWSTTLANVLGYEIPQTFELYVVNIDGTRTLLATVDNEYTYSYTVPQLNEGYTIEYQINAVPSENNASFDPVWSNLDRVYIPGLNAGDMRLVINDEIVLSAYDRAAEVNRYANTISMDNADGNKIHGSDVNVGTLFNFYRKTVTGTDTTAVKVAQVEITSITGNNYAYSVTYMAQSPEADASLYPAATGTFTSPSQYGEIDFRDFAICDQFTASTQANEQPAFYLYEAKMAPAGEEVYYSNEVVVKVYKTASTVADKQITAEQMAADVNRSVPVGPDMAQLSFNVKNDPAINEYQAFATAQFGRAQNMTNGNYAVWELQGGSFVNVAEVTDVATVADEATAPAGRDNYVPVIVVNTPDELPNNTYGCDVKPATIIDVEATLLNQSSLTMGAIGTDGIPYTFGVEIEATGVLPESGVEVVRYRMWRELVDNPGTYTLCADVETAETKVTLTDNGSVVLPEIEDSLNVNYYVRLYCKDASGMEYYMDEAMLQAKFHVMSSAIDRVNVATGALKVYPTLTAATLNVAGAESEVVVYSTTGARVLTAPAGTAMLNVSSLPAGHYIVKSGSSTARFIKR